MPSLESQASMQQNLREDPEEQRDEQTFSQTKSPSPVRSRLLMLWYAALPKDDAYGPRTLK